LSKSELVSIIFAYNLKSIFTGIAPTSMIGFKADNAATDIEVQRLTFLALLQIDTNPRSPAGSVHLLA